MQKIWGKTKIWCTFELSEETDGKFVSLESYLAQDFRKDKGIIKSPSQEADIKTPDDLSQHLQSQSQDRIRESPQAEAWRPAADEGGVRVQDGEAGDQEL